MVVEERPEDNIEVDVHPTPEVLQGYGGYPTPTVHTDHSRARTSPRRRCDVCTCASFQSRTEHPAALAQRQETVSRSGRLAAASSNRRREGVTSSARRREGTTSQERSGNTTSRRRIEGSASRDRSGESRSQNGRTDTKTPDCTTREEGESSGRKTGRFPTGERQKGELPGSRQLPWSLLQVLRLTCLSGTVVTG